MQNRKKGVNTLLLIITAFIWGTAFVAQSTGGSATGPYTFSCLRYIIGGAVLIPVILIFDKTNIVGKKPTTKKELKELFKGGVCCGICLSAASIMQQVGIYLGTSAGKAGFLTACYIVLVPILGLFLRKKCGLNIWIAVGAALLGLYLLCIKESLKIEKCDVLVIICSVIFAMHILTIDHFLEKDVHPVRMSCIQFFFAGVVAFFPMFFIESGGEISGFISQVQLAFSEKALFSLLYAGLMSSGVAYTLQIVAQKGVNPSVASLIMSLESVFAVLAGWVVLGEKMSVREIIGCVLIFFAITLAQVNIKEKNRHEV